MAQGQLMADDRFANIATISTTESAANTLTFNGIQTGVGAQFMLGMIIDKIHYYVDDAFDELVGAGDKITVAITISNKITSIGDISDRRILHSFGLERQDGGAPVDNPLIYKSPEVVDFTPPILHAEQNMWLGVKGNSLANPVTCAVRVYFRYIALTDKNFVELAQTFQLVGAGL